MKKLSVIIAAVLFSFGVANAVAPVGDDTNEASHNIAISIPTVALVDVEGSDGNEAGTINLIPDVSALEAGAAVDFGTATDNSLWLNYTSVIASDQDNRSITAEYSGTLPTGVSLKVLAGAATTGNGTRGNSSGEVTLTNSGQDLVTGIGSCYTESGYEKGHQLTYALDMNSSSYADLAAGSYNVTVTYTITGN